MRKVNNYIFNVEEFSNRITKQIQQIQEIILNSGRTEFSRQELEEILNEGEKNGTLITRQAPWRIFSYYKNEMIRRGSLEVRSTEMEDKNSEELEEVINI